MKLHISSEATEFAHMVGQGVESWKKAGAIIAANYHRDPTFLRQCQEASGLMEHTLKFFIRIGNGTLNPRLLLRDSQPGVKRAMLLPMAEQTRLEKEAIDLVVGGAIEQVSIFDMDRAQARLAFGPNGVRTIAQQKAFLARQKSPSTPWRIQGDRVVFLRGAILTARQLQSILDDLAKPE